MKIMNSYTFQGRMQFTTFEGPQEIPLGFSLILADDNPPMEEVEQAARAISMFLMKEYMPEAKNDEEFLNGDPKFN